MKPVIHKTDDFITEDLITVDKIENKVTDDVPIDTTKKDVDKQK